MKKYFSLLYLLLFIALATCSEVIPLEEEPEVTEEAIKVTGTVYLLARERGNLGGKFRSTNTKTGGEVQYNLECFNLSSSFYDPRTEGFGFVNCDRKFRLINPVNGDEIRSFDLEHDFGATVMNHEAYEMIGIYRSGGTNFRIARYNLENGDLISDQPLAVGSGNSCIHHYSQTKKEYYMVTPFGVTVIDPSTGKTLRQLEVDFRWDQVNYDERSHTFSRIHYPEDGDPYLEHIDAEDGSSISQTPTSLTSPRSCFFDFDYMSPDFIMVSHPSKVIYADSETARSKKTYEVRDDVLPFMVWRRQ